MHRSGTSAFARGVAALGVYLGENFLDAQDDNPTGYWEDKGIFDLNERVLAAIGLTWTDTALIDDVCWKLESVQALRTEAINYLRSKLAIRPVWGFKDPRTVRLLPFWRSVFLDLDADDRYLIAIRNPLSVAASLAERQGMDQATSHVLWLAYMVPYLNEIATRPFVAADYDLLMSDPAEQLDRIASALELSIADEQTIEIASFVSDFLDPDLRHNKYGRYDFPMNPAVTPLAREAYLWLEALATDRVGPDLKPFWSAWERIREAVVRLLADSAVAR
jgi:O-antigen biosynthesis protein